MEINKTILQRGGWYLDPMRRHYHKVPGGVLDTQVKDLRGKAVAPAAGQLCTTTASLNWGCYTQGNAVALVVNPAQQKYKHQDHYGALYAELMAGAEPTSDVWYRLPYDCAENSRYESHCDRLPSLLANDAKNLHLYSDADAAPSRNIHVFVRLSHQLLRRAGVDKRKQHRVLFQLGTFQYVGVSKDKTRVQLRPLPRRATRLPRSARSPGDLSAARELLTNEQDNA